MLPLILFVVFQFLILVGMFDVFGVFESMQSNFLMVFESSAEMRAGYLQNDVLNKWSQLDTYQGSLGNIIKLWALAQDVQPSDLPKNPKLREKVLSESFEMLVNMLRAKETTGAFIYLDTECSGSERQCYNGLYICDYDPSTNEGMDDIFLVRGNAAMTKNRRACLDADWQSNFQFNENNENLKFFNRVEENGRRTAYVSSGLLGGWQTSTSVDDATPRDTLMYAEPIIIDGKVLGVIGITVSMKYLETRLPYREVAENRKGVYCLCRTKNDSQDMEVVVSSGAMRKMYMGNANTLRLGENQKASVYRLEIPNNENRYQNTLLASVKKINFYNRYSAIEDEHFFLLGIAPEQEILQSMISVREAFIYTVIALSLVAILLSVFSAMNTVRPIIILTDELKAMNPSRSIRLRPSKVNEINLLKNVVESLSDRVAAAASKTSKIIDMGNLNMGVFEYPLDGIEVFCSGGLIRLAGEKGANAQDQYMPRAAFELLRQRLVKKPYGDYDGVFELNTSDGVTYIRIREVTEEKNCFGVVNDVTREVEERKRIEYELDYDVLIGLYNRRAFLAKAEKLIEKGREALGCAAVLMMDLDNLKYVNDVFGHESGDSYISAFADSLSALDISQHTLIARRSGDEFLVLFYGFPTKQEVLHLVSEFFNNTYQKDIALSGNRQTRIRVSGGIAWYPDDAQDLQTLINYADFAMYTVKHSKKGRFEEFNAEAFKMDFILLRGHEELNLIIETGRMLYALQPIVSVETADIYGYEMLMRPQSSLLKSPYDVLRLAKVNSKLGEIERLTWFGALETVRLQLDRGSIRKSDKIFINSIASQLLEDADKQRIEKKYADILGNLVLETTESEMSNQTITEQKRQFVKKHKALMAIDDFSSGFNKDAALIQTAPDIIKLDISITTGIDTDESRRLFVRSIVAYADKLGIKVLAEGVETYGQMEVLIQLGIRYLQGYYLAAPALFPPVIEESKLQEIIEIRSRRE